MHLACNWPSLTISRASSGYRGRTFQAVAAHGGQQREYATVAHQLQQYALIDEKTQRYQDELRSVTGKVLACPPGCGKCCLSPNVESTPWECLPMAQELVGTGKAEEVLERLEAAEAAGSPQCVMYEPNGPLSGGKGQCSTYATRPLVCRLFGFAAVRAKDGTPDASVCKVMKEVTPDSVSAAKTAVRAGRVHAPIFAEEWAELHASVGSAHQSAVMPINQALHEALKQEMWLAYLASMSAEEGASSDGA